MPRRRCVTRNRVIPDTLDSSTALIPATPRGHVPHSLSLCLSRVDVCCVCRHHRNVSRLLATDDRATSNIYTYLSRDSSKNFPYRVRFRVRRSTGRSLPVASQRRTTTRRIARGARNSRPVRYIAKSTFSVKFNRRSGAEFAAGPSSDLLGVTKWADDLGKRRMAGYEGSFGA